MKILCCFYRLVTSWYLVISSSTNGQNTSYLCKKSSIDKLINAEKWCTNRQVTSSLSFSLAVIETLYISQ